MPAISRFEEIEAWKTARQLTNLIYKISSQGEFARDFGLKDQIRRAAVSVMSNIAEGFESQTQAQFIRYLSIAKASSAEVRSQLYIALDQNYITKEQFDHAFDIADKALRQLAGFIAYLKSHPRPRGVREEDANYSTE
ncbi:MAG: four helix bundle protein [Anaerolinea sp. 4484_236]|nr:MAG: four helix bundle protein [Anaerolinea sp. 4484_236]